MGQCQQFLGKKINFTSNPLSDELFWLLLSLFLANLQIYLELRVGLTGTKIAVKKGS